jgi:hypothetical protein
VALSLPQSVQIFLTTWLFPCGTVPPDSVLAESVERELRRINIPISIRLKKILNEKPLLACSLALAFGIVTNWVFELLKVLYGLIKN